MRRRRGGGLIVVAKKHDVGTCDVGNENLKIRPAGIPSTNCIYLNSMLIRERINRSENSSENDDAFEYNCTRSLLWGQYPQKNTKNKNDGLNENVWVHSETSNYCEVSVRQKSRPLKSRSLLWGQYPPPCVRRRRIILPMAPHQAAPGDGTRSGHVRKMRHLEKNRRQAGKK